MKNKRKILLFCIILCFVLSIVFINRINDDSQIDGWREFKKTVIESNDFIDDVNIDNFMPTDIRIVYKLDRRINADEMSQVFVDTKKYILLERTFADLQKYHADKFKYSFSNIVVVFSYRKDKTDFICNISSAQDNGGEPSNKDFNTWYIECNSGPIRKYSSSLE